MIARYALIAAVALSALAGASLAAEPRDTESGAKINPGQATQPPSGAPSGSMTQSGSGTDVQNKAAPVGDAKAGAAGETPIPNPDEAKAALAPSESGPIGATRQTMPAKFSERNDKLDHLPIMAAPLPLSDEQKRKIVDAVRAGGSRETVALDAKPAMQVPTDITLNTLPESVSDLPAVQNYRFIQLKDRIVLVNPTDRTVVGEIKE